MTSISAADRQMCQSSIRPLARALLQDQATLSPLCSPVMDYRTAGVDVVAGRAFVERIRASVEATHRPEVVGGLGGFGGLTRLPAGLERPLLVAGTDGVGTKLELAQAHGRHHNVGIDLVAMCVNDVITSGAEPLLFLDYMATGKLTPEAMAAVVEGIADGCRQSGCSLLGGETAEMPGFYSPGRYDLAGFCLAVVDEARLIDGRSVTPGDAIVAVASSGVHSNGFSLVRRILEDRQIDSAATLPGTAVPLIEALLEPTRLYASLVRMLLAAELPLNAMAHITGGGLPENLPRCLPVGTCAALDPTSWERPALFTWLQDAGSVPEADLWHTFNLGVGFCLVVPAGQQQRAISLCDQAGHRAWQLGEVQSRSDGSPALAGLPC
jgi:phosphoribosylformylglycinamidine cyclo-ligase